MRDLLIVGAGGHAREILDLVRAINEDAATWNVVGLFADQSPETPIPESFGVGLVGPSAQAAEYSAAYVIAIGSPRARKKVDEMMRPGRAEPAVLRHPTVTVGAEVDVGPGCVLAAGSILTTNIRLERHVHVNVGASISHDCRLDAYATLAPGARLAGAVYLESGVDFGIGAVARPGVRVGAWAVVGAGSAVVRDIGAGAVVGGVPAREVNSGARA